MEHVSSALQNLEQDGKQYAHFVTHPNNPGYYGLLIRQKTPEHVSLWLAESPLAGYELIFTIEMADITFTDYIAELFPTQQPVYFLNTLYSIDNFTEEAATTWAGNFKAWKQEKIRLHRSRILDQYPWVTSWPTQALAEKE